MHQVLPFFGGLFLFASCSVQYQYGTISSHSVALNDKYEFVADNDTLSIRYSFGGPGAPVVMVIENKLDLPVYIDWKESALIMNGKALTYAPSEIPITGNLSMTRTNSGSRTEPYSTGSIDAVANLKPGMDFMPPHTFIEKKPLALPVWMLALPDSISHKVTMQNGFETKFKVGSYSDSTSPFRFRTYLSFAVGELTAKPQRIEHSFFVSQLITTKLAPEGFNGAMQNRADKYYLSETTDGGGGAAVIGLLVGGTLLVAAMASAGRGAPDPD